MNLRPSTRHRQRQNAILLVEAMVYIGMLALIGTVALGTFHHFWLASRRLEQNADDILRALHAGERWREDIRHANGPLLTETDGTDQALAIPQSGRMVTYLFSHDGVWRRDNHDLPWTQFLPQARHSLMRPDPRTMVTAWCWEVELSTGKRTPRTPPRFTFLAVPGTFTTPTP